MENKNLSTIYFENNANYYHVWRSKPNFADQVQHQKDYYEICFVLKGQLCHQHDQNKSILAEGDCFIVPPGFQHSVESLAEETVCFWLVFQESLLFPGYQYGNVHKLLSSLSMESYGQVKNAQLRIGLSRAEQENISRLFECLLYESFSVQEQDSNAVMLIASIVSTVARNYFKDPTMEQELNRINEYDAIMIDCIRYIDENYMKQLTISHMAKRFAVSASHFSIMFPKVAGVPFKQYLNRKRINAAVALCADQTLPFHKIAAMCGYLDTSTFYRNFIKYMGISPTSFRTQLQNTPM